jgi:hemolysin III
MKQAVLPESSPPKPLLRGVLHQVASFVALVAGALLVARTPSEDRRQAALVYMVCLTTLFGVSGAYHVPTWTPRARQWMRRLDHAAIFLLIAGTYTPLSIALGPEDGAMLRKVVWGGALAGVFQSVLWVTAPKPLIALIYVILGWSILPYVGRMYAAVGPWPLMLILGGGVLYSLGALVYAKKRPNPVPEVFGYHEVFHTMVIGAAVFHFAAVAGIVLRGG